MKLRQGRSSKSGKRGAGGPWDTPVARTQRRGPAGLQDGPGEGPSLRHLLDAMGRRLVRDSPVNGCSFDKYFLTWLWVDYFSSDRL